MNAIRIVLINDISHMLPIAIESTISNAVTFDEFVITILIGAKLRLRLEGKAYLTANDL